MGVFSNHPSQSLRNKTGSFSEGLVTAAFFGDIGDRVEKNLVLGNQVHSVLFDGHQVDCCSHGSSGGVSGEGNTRCVEVHFLAVLLEPFNGGPGLLYWDGELGFRRTGIVDEENGGVGFFHEVEDETTMSVGGSEDPATSMEIEGDGERFAC